MPISYNWGFGSRGRTSAEAQRKMTQRAKVRRRLMREGKWDAAMDQRMKIAATTLDKLKKVMAEKKLTTCRANCPMPDCEGKIHVRQNGMQKHLHVKCDTCDFIAME